LRPRPRPRLLTTAIVVALSGAITVVAAVAHVGPFGALGAQAQQHAVAVQGSSAPLRADSLFPPPTAPPAVHQVVVIADSAHPSSSSPPRTPEPRETPEPTAAPTPTASSSPTVCHDECDGGGDGGGGGGDH
jgi:hypothetical protein